MPTYFSVCIGALPLSRKEKGTNPVRQIPAIFFEQDEAIKYAMDFNNSSPPVRAYVSEIELVSARVKNRRGK